MKRAVCFFMIALIFLMSSCRQADELSGNRPIVDTMGVDPYKYEADLEECYAFADQVQAGRKVGSGAATGAVMGGVVGAVIGDSGTAKRSAGVGAASGTFSGAASAMNERHRVVRNCLSGRGYRVLN